MGQVHAHSFWWKSATNPDYKSDPQFPPNYGYDENVERKPRVMIATPEEIIAAKVPHKYRDFCAHKYIQFKNCTRSVYPFTYRCKHERHEWELCELEDHIISRKEYERERRLLVRKANKERLEKLKEERRQHLAQCEAHGGGEAHADEH